MNDFINQPSFPLIAFLFVASPICWVIFAFLVRSRGPLKLEPRQPIPWGMLDLLFVMFFLILGQGVMVLWLESQGIDLTKGVKLAELAAADQAKVILGNSVATFVSIILAVLFVKLKNRASLADLGFDFGRAPRDVLLGTFAFLLIGPPVLAIQATLVIWWPSKHPLVEMLKEDPSMHFFLVTIFAALIVAPLIEELMYRVLLQGWLEKFSTNADQTQLIVGALPFETVEQKEEPAQSKPLEKPETPVRWPIFVSAAIFAAMHHQHGPDPIPLFLFAVGLGYLYQRTHRILPSIVVHFLLNATSVAVLMLDLPGKD